MCDKIEEINILGNISNFIVFDSEQKKVDKKKNTVYIHFLTEFLQSIERWRKDTFTYLSFKVLLYLAYL